MHFGPENEVLYVGFNQDHSCFGCGKATGFGVYSCDVFKERFCRDFDRDGAGGGIGIVELLFKCNILALVGGGNNPKYPKNKVMIWDDYQNKCICELEFRSEVKAVKLRRDRIVVVLENKVYVYNFADLVLLHQFETTSNPKGLCALSHSDEWIVLACPGNKPGRVRVELFHKKNNITIEAHNNPLNQLALNLNGDILATASEKGTLVRLWDTQTGRPLKEFRRGADRAEISTLSFNQTSTYLCVGSDKGTVHVYALESEQQKEDARNRQSSLNFMKDVLPSYFGSEWSFAQFRVPETHFICCFGTLEKNSVIVVGNGTYYKYTFDPIKGGEGKLETYSEFKKVEEVA